MLGPKVLVDTNILVSGLVFTKGNEHQILRLAEEDKITLIIPEIVVAETEKVLKEKFEGFERLLEILLERLSSESVPTEQVLGTVHESTSLLSDAKDASIYAAIVVAKPDFAINGDKRLRSDLRKSPNVAGQTKILSSADFLQQFRK